MQVTEKELIARPIRTVFQAPPQNGLGIEFPFQTPGIRRKDLEEFNIRWGGMRSK